MSTQQQQQDGQAQHQEIVVAVKRRDPKSHYTWLDFSGFPGKKVHDRLRAGGWKWSPYRKQYYTNARFTRIPDGIAVTDGGTCAYSAERAARLDARADRHQALSDAAYQKQDAIGRRIPLGQPILVGHHSERGHRADLKRMHRLMDTCVAESNTAEKLRHRADRSERLQAYKETPGKMARTPA